MPATVKKASTRKKSTTKPATKTTDRGTKSSGAGNTVKTNRNRGEDGKKSELSKSGRLMKAKAERHDGMLESLRKSGKEVKVYKSDSTFVSRLVEMGITIVIPTRKDGKHGDVGGPPSLFEDIFCDWLLEWLSEGRSLETFGVCIHRKKNAAFLPSVATIQNWYQKYPQFQHAKELGEQLYAAFWEDAGVSNLYYNQESPIQFNDRLWYKFMSHKLGWAKNMNMTADMNINVVTSIPRPKRIDSKAVVAEKV